MRLILLFILCWSTGLQAADEVIINRPSAAGDKRSEYTFEILRTALKKTEASFGAYTFKLANVHMQRANLASAPMPANDRLLHEIKRGELITVAALVTRPEWENEALVVRIPLERGLMSYRVFLIRRQDQTQFSALRNLSELKALRSGAGETWSNYRVLQHHGFTLIPTNDYEGQFRMLVNGRFDYITRGVHEAFVEIKQYGARFPQMAIEEELLLHLPLPQYFFVSPRHPQLAKRIEAGLKIMLRDGSFERIFQRHHGKLISAANFCTRRVFRIDNPFLGPETPLDKTEYWFDPWRATPGRKALCPGRPA